MINTKALVCSSLSDDLSGVSLSEIKISEPKDQEILIEVKAASVNFPDLLMTQGKYQHKPDMPFVLGMEGSGIVKEIGTEVKKFEIGDEVTFAEVVGIYRLSYVRETFHGLKDDSEIPAHALSQST